MQVTVERVEDRSDPDAEVYYEYIYDLYLFQEGSRFIRVCRYPGTAEASVESKWPEIPGLLDLLPQIMARLRADGVRILLAYNPQQGGYSPMRISAEYAHRLGYITAEQATFLRSL